MAGIDFCLCVVQRDREAKKSSVPLEYSLVRWLPADSCRRHGKASQQASKSNYGPVGEIDEDRGFWRWRV